MHYKIVKFFALILGLESYLVISGWVFGVNIIGTIITHGSNMKLSSGLGFLFSAFLLYFLTRHMENKDQPARVMLLTIASFMFLTMILLFISHFSGFQTTLENLFVRESSPSILFGSGAPGLITIINFILFALISMCSFFPGRTFGVRLRVFGYIIIALALIPVFGNWFGVSILNQPFAADLIPMASLSFVLLGAGLVILGSAKNKVS